VPTRRVRADVALVEAGLFPSREQARAAILEGRVKVGGCPVTKAGQPVGADASFEVREAPRYVSRGGVKLAGALEAFGIDPTGLAAIDVGASTGGFTDCLLQRGAASVTALDVGYGQLAWELRRDPRVRVVERTNIRTADAATLGGPYDLATIDVSFISLAAVLPAVLPVVTHAGSVIALVKPQFEAGKGRVGKRGVVRDRAVHEQVLRSVEEVSDRLGLVVRGLAFSPITGPEGNIEFWIWLARRGPATTVTPQEVVASAHERLGGAGARPDRTEP
jgi:23S rRNA (cytidine1920-2'-O)/16S rRNA (cytidine1409-2'-O)-methyltransferase